MKLAAQLQWSAGAFDLHVDLNLTAPITGLFGPSGSGKTSLLHLLAGLTRPRLGKILLDDVILCDTAAGLHLPPHRRAVGVVFQDARLLPHLTVAQNLCLSPAARASAGGSDFQHICTLLELADLLPRPVQTLSGGEAQRVALARAVLARPRLLLLDEPIASLDAARRQTILPLLQRLAHELHLPLLLVSHQLEDVLQVTDELVLLERGRCVGAGSYRDLCMNPSALTLLAQAGLRSVWTLQVLRHDDAAGCTMLSWPTAGDDAATVLQVPRWDMPPTARVQVELLAQDTAIAVGPTPGVSIRNQLPATITRMTTHQGQVLLELNAGAPLLAEISAGSAQRLALQPGKAVYALIKANAIRRLSAAG